jgi:hypothetical protein
VVALGDGINTPFCCDIDINLWGQGVECYSLDLECPLMSCVLKSWLPACGTVGIWWNLRRWGLLEGS